MDKILKSLEKRIDKQIKSCNKLSIALNMAKKGLKNLDANIKINSPVNMTFISPEKSKSNILIPKKSKSNILIPKKSKLDKVIPKKSKLDGVIPKKSKLDRPNNIAEELVANPNAEKNMTNSNDILKTIQTIYDTSCIESENMREHINVRRQMADLKEKRRQCLIEEQAKNIPTPISEKPENNVSEFTALSKYSFKQQRDIKKKLFDKAKRNVNEIYKTKYDVDITPEIEHDLQPKYSKAMNKMMEAWVAAERKK